MSPRMLTNRQFLQHRMLLLSWGFRMRLNYRQMRLPIRRNQMHRTYRMNLQLRVRWSRSFRRHQMRLLPALRMILTLPMHLLCLMYRMIPAFLKHPRLPMLQKNLMFPRYRMLLMNPSFRMLLLTSSEYPELPMRRMLHLNPKLPKSLKLPMLPMLLKSLMYWMLPMLLKNLMHWMYPLIPMYRMLLTDSMFPMYWTHPMHHWLPKLRMILQPPMRSMTCPKRLRFRMHPLPLMCRTNPARQSCLPRLTHPAYWKLPLFRASKTQRIPKARLPQVCRLLRQRLTLRKRSYRLSCRTSMQPGRQAVMMACFPLKQQAALPKERLALCCLSVPVIVRFPHPSRMQQA